MTTRWKNDLAGLSDLAWTRLRTRVEGLTDEEYFWEPAPLCWNVRQSPDGTYRGDWRLLSGGQSGATPPFTTIAWRISHIIHILADPRYAAIFGYDLPTVDLDHAPGNSADAFSTLESSYEITRQVLEQVNDDVLAEPLGPAGGRWAQSDKASFILHMLDELIHHSAEVGVLRDLYRATRPQDPLVVAVLEADVAAVNAARTKDPDSISRLLADRPGLLIEASEIGRWGAIPILVELGFPLARDDGRSALHHAAGAGSLESVRLLVSAGADPHLQDPVFHADALGWAEHFQQPTVASYLRGIIDSVAEDRNESE